MSLSINSSKIEEELSRTDKTYAVYCRQLDSLPIEPEEPSVSVFGTVSKIPYDVERSKERLLSLRKQIVESSAPLLDAEELQREINEIRGSTKE
jgi:hypothetical protein